MSEAARKDLAPRAQAQVVQADATSIMEVLSRAAADPNTDADKLERLLGMYERINVQQAKAAYTSALARMQPELPVITERGGIKNNSGEIQSTYAKWEDINSAIGPILAQHGFALSFRTGVAQDGKITVTGVLAHEGGHSEETTITLPHDSSGSKNAVQAVGSSTSYGKRYTAIALLNITSRAPQDRDDDGQAGGLSEAAREAMADINMAEGAVELGLWKKEKADAVKAKVPLREWNEIVALWNRRARAAKAGAANV